MVASGLLKFTSCTLSGRSSTSRKKYLDGSADDLTKLHDDCGKSFDDGERPHDTSIKSLSVECHGFGLLKCPDFVYFNMMRTPTILSGGANLDAKARWW